MDDELTARKYVRQGSYPGKSMAVLTSGGDSQGMNAALRSIVRMCFYLGCEIFLVHEGYNGLVNGNFTKATWSYVSGIVQKGGTVIGSSRSDEFRTVEGRYKCCQAMLRNRISYLIVIGGDGSLTGADQFQKEWPNHVKAIYEKGEVSKDIYEQCLKLHICGLVGSIDNDFFGTDLTIGAYSALHRIQEATDSIVSTAYSHQRIFIFEVMGRRCGYLALFGGLTCEADYIFIPEMPVPDNWIDELKEKILMERSQGKRLNIIIVAEGATDRNGNPIKASDIQKAVVDNIHLDTRITVLGHVQRGGNACAIDRSVATRMGTEASIAVLERSQCVIAIDGNVIVRRDLMECVMQTRAVAEALKNRDWEAAMKLRGGYFVRAYKMYKVLTIRPHSPEKENRNLAIMHLGTPTNGMNAVAYSFVRSAIISGYTPWGINDSMQGLLRDNVVRLTWHDVNGWVAEGGSKLGSKHSVPEERLEKVAAKIKEYNFHGILFVGDYNALTAAIKLYEARNTYPEFWIPICVVPATIDNNIPGTEVSIGCDTALNEIAKCCDTLKLAASGTKRRVYIVETMGGYCGYLATLGGLCAGADDVFINEQPFSIMDILKSCYHIASKMSTGIQRGLVIRNEFSNTNYTTEFMKNLYEREGYGMFTVRTNVMAHIQQGGSPSPFDRDYGIKMGMKALEWFIGQNRSMGDADTLPTNECTSAVLIGLMRRHFYFSPLNLLKEITDFKTQVPYYQWWLRLKDLVTILATHDSSMYEEAVYMPSKHDR